MIQHRIVDVYQARAGDVMFATPLAGAYNFRRLEIADFEKSPLGQEKGRAANFAQRLRQGHYAWGYVATNGALACYLWLSSPRLGPAAPDFECGLRAGISSNAIYIWDCRTHPDYERQGLYRHGLIELASRAPELGAQFVLIVTRRENVRSRNSIVGVGFRQIATLNCFRLGGMVLVAGSGTMTVMRVGSTIILPRIANLQ